MKLERCLFTSEYNLKIVLKLKTSYRNWCAKDLVVPNKIKYSKDIRLVNYPSLILLKMTFCQGFLNLSILRL